MKGSGRLLAVVFCAVLGISSVAGASVAVADPVTFTATASAAPGSVLVAAPDGSFSFVVSGTAAAGDLVELGAPVGGSLVPLCTTVADVGEDWSCTVTAGPSSPGPLRASAGPDSVDLAIALLHHPAVTTDPATPGALASTGTADAPSQTITGTGAPGALLTLAVSDGGGCTATVGADGLWSCVLTALPSGAGPFTLVASQAYPTAPGTVAESEPVAFVPAMTTIVVPGGPVMPDPGGPAVPAAPEVPGAPGVPGTPPAGEVIAGAPVAPAAPGAAVSTEGPVEGDGVTTSSRSPEAAAGPGDSDGPGGSGGPGDSSDSGDSSASGSVTASAAGTGTPRVRPGDGGASRRDVPPATDSLEAASPPVPSIGADAGDPHPARSAGGFGQSLRDAGAVLALPPSAVALAGALVAGIVFLVWLPGGLLESTLHENHPRIRRSAPVRALAALIGTLRVRSGLSGRAGRRGGTGHPPRPGETRFTGSSGRRAVTAGVALVAGAAASVAVIPGAGFDPEGAGLFLCFLVALAVANAVPLGVAAGFAARRLAMGSVPYARWTALGLTVVSVVASRIAELEPGFVFGAIIALRFAAPLGPRLSARITVVATATSLALGTLTWIALSALRATGTEGGSPIAEVLTAITVCALSGPVVSLLPVRFLDGRSVFAVSKRLWAGLYAIATGLFVLVLLPLPAAWSELGGDVAGWLVALAAASALSVGVWAYFRFVPERRTPQDRPRLATPSAHASAEARPQRVGR